MVEFGIDDIKIEAETAPDQFSPKGLDKGTRLLIEQAIKLDAQYILDWGCGWGAIGLSMARHKPTAQITALDSDIGAVATAQVNASHNHLHNMTVVASHGFAQLPKTQKFDLILSHPPTHRGRIVVEDMVAESFVRLKDGGQLLIVVEARIKPWLARSITHTFGDYKIVKRGPKYVVLRGQK